MKRFTEIPITTQAEDGTTIKDRIDNILKRVTDAAPATDELCPDCRGTGKVYGDPSHPERGVLDCKRAECLERRQAGSAKHKPLSPKPSDPDAEVM